METIVLLPWGYVTRKMAVMKDGLLLKLKKILIPWRIVCRMIELSI